MSPETRAHLHARIEYLEDIFANLATTGRQHSTPSHGEITVDHPAQRRLAVLVRTHIELARLYLKEMTQ